MKKIVAIGGGDFTTKSTLAIDREIIRLSRKNHPKFLFIPTASTDSVDYWNEMNQYYGKTLGCKTDVLYLITEPPSPKVIREKILSADIIYVGGGNTLRMMRCWRKLGVDKLLKSAWEKGIVLCGVSAGSICWHDSGHSDSMSFYNPKEWEYINVKGLGFLKGIHCPHYDSETLGVKRRDNFKRMLKKTGGLGIAIEDSCAIEYIDDKFRVIPSIPGKNAYKVFKRNGKVVEIPIQKSKDLLPIDLLYKTFSE